MRLPRLGVPLLTSPEQARAMYAGGRGNAAARRWARFWVAVLGLGLLPGHGVVLEVPGRRSGKLRRFPLVEVRLGRDRYLVSMLGEECNWVRNVRAAGGTVRLRHGKVEEVRLVDVSAEQRAHVLKRYVDRAPGARPHIPIDRRQDVSAFETIAARYPVFRIEPKPRPW
jgi:deazaflavin-dependent oxidoreductase (nitroreductase family)